MEKNEMMKTLEREDWSYEGFANIRREASSKRKDKYEIEMSEGDFLSGWFRYDGKDIYQCWVDSGKNEEPKWYKIPGPVEKIKFQIIGMVLYYVPFPNRGMKWSPECLEKLERNAQTYNDWLGEKEVRDTIFEATSVRGETPPPEDIETDPGKNREFQKDLVEGLCWEL